MGATAKRNSLCKISLDLIEKIHLRREAILSNQGILIPKKALLSKKGEIQDLLEIP